MGAPFPARHRRWQAPRVPYSHVPPHIRGAPPHLACDLLSWFGSAPLLAQSSTETKSRWETDRTAAPAPWIARISLFAYVGLAPHAWIGAAAIRRTARLPSGGNDTLLREQR